MLRSVNDLIGYVLQAQDGEIGRCKDFLFDDEHWTIRYMVADTGKWLPGEKVLVSPISLDKPDWDSHHFPVRLTKQQLEDRPPLDEEAPVSRQYERSWHMHYGWPYYWAGPGVWGTAAYPPMLFVQQAHPEQQEPEERPEESHLRSVDEVKGYGIKAEDGDIGHVDNFIVDDMSWTLRYVVVDTRNILPGKKVLVATQWLKLVDWHTRELTVDLTTDEIKGSPEYDPTAPVNRDYEEELFDYYGRPVPKE